MRETFEFYDVYLEAARQLPVEKRLEFIESICNYFLEGVPLDAHGDKTIEIAYAFIEAIGERR